MSRKRSQRTSQRVTESWARQPVERHFSRRRGATSTARNPASSSRLSLRGALLSLTAAEPVGHPQPGLLQGWPAWALPEGGERGRMAPPAQKPLGCGAHLPLEVEEDLPHLWRGSRAVSSTWAWPLSAFPVPTPCRGVGGWLQSPPSCPPAAPSPPLGHQTPGAELRPRERGQRRVLPFRAPCSPGGAWAQDRAEGLQGSCWVLPALGAAHSHGAHPWLPTPGWAEEEQELSLQHRLKRE